MTNELIKIKTIDLTGIAVAAEIWFKKQNEIFHNFDKELNAATTLKKALYKTNWDEETELFIDELPF